MRRAVPSSQARTNLTMIEVSQRPPAGADGPSSRSRDVSRRLVAQILCDARALIARPRSSSGIRTGSCGAAVNLAPAAAISWGNHLRSFQLYDVVLQWERPPATAASSYVSVVSAGVSDASFGFRFRRVLGPRWQLKHHRLLTLFKAG